MNETTDENNICIVCDNEKKKDNPLYKMKCCQVNYHLTCFNKDIDIMKNQNKFECRYCGQNLNTYAIYSLKKRDANTSRLHLIKKLLFKINSVVFIIFSLYSLTKLMYKKKTVCTISLFLFFLYSNLLITVH